MQCLWGFNVYGCSSMGALRAAELSAFGMEGRGEIFSRYAAGEWEDDDEVALIHAPAPLRYQPISRAMVDLRHDLQRACEESIISRAQAEQIAGALKRLWYPHRDVIGTLPVFRGLSLRKPANSIANLFGAGAGVIKAARCD